jgi:hypothetical protein
VERCEHEVEAGQDLVGEIQRAVWHDVHLDAVQDGQRPEARPGGIDFDALPGDVRPRQGARRSRPLRMVRDRDEVVIEVARRRRHLSDAVTPVAPGAVHVEIPADMRDGDERRQHAARRPFDLVGALTQFRRDVRQLQAAIELALAGAGDGGTGARQSARLETGVERTRALLQKVCMRLRSGMPHECGAGRFGIGDMDGDRSPFGCRRGARYQSVARRCREGRGVEGQSVAH